MHPAEIQRRIDQTMEKTRACAHSDYIEGDALPYTGPVAEYGGSDENRYAHGGICVTRTCRACRATRRVNLNGHHQEWGAWHADIDELLAAKDAAEDAARAARQKAEADRQLASIEAKAWSGDVLRVEGASPVAVQVAVYDDTDDYIQLSLDGVSRAYSLAEVERTASSSQLDDAQRTAWALIARRARRAIREAR